MKTFAVLCGLIVAGLLAAPSPGEDRAGRGRRQDARVGPVPLPHEGVAVNGLRLEVRAHFVPEEDGWGSPKLHTTFTFFNETDTTIVLDGYGLHYRLVLSRLGPADAVRISRQQPGLSCGIPPRPEHLIRVPPHGKHVVSHSGWCQTFAIPYGASVGGKVVDEPLSQQFDLLRCGRLTLAFLYRSDGAISMVAELSKLLRKGERLWSGRVYSNPVVIDVSHLHRIEPVPPKFTGTWTERYPSGKPSRVVNYKDGVLHGMDTHYGINGHKSWEQEHRDGVPEGTYTVYDSEGRKDFQQMQRSGTAHGAMTWWYPSGRKKAEQEVKNGRSDGLSREWFESGALKAAGRYRKGHKSGPWLEWDERGKVVAATMYKELVKH
jgi:hypothetical protein